MRKLVWQHLHAALAFKLTMEINKKGLFPDLFWDSPFWTVKLLVSNKHLGKDIAVLTALGDADS